MAEVLEEKSGVMGMKIDLLLLLSVDSGEVQADCWYTFRAAVGPLYLIFTIVETAQTWISFFFFYSTFKRKTFEKAYFNEYILNHTEVLLWTLMSCSLV